MTHLEGQVGTAGGVGHDEGLDAHADHDADGQDHLVHAVAFVVMDAALHGDDGFAAQLTHDEVSLVAHCRGHGEARQLPVGDDDGIGDGFGQAAQAASEDDAQHGLAGADAAPDGVGEPLDGLDSRVHIA